MIVNVFGVCYSGYFEDPRRYTTKTLAKELLFKHDIRPPYTNVDQWNAKKCKLLINVKYLTILSMIYEREKVNYTSKNNALHS